MGGLPAVSDPSKDLTIEVELEPAPSPAASTTSHSTTPGTTVIPGVGTAYVSIQECTRPAPANVGPPVTKTVALATFIPQLPSSEGTAVIQGKLLVAFYYAMQSTCSWPCLHNALRLMEPPAGTVAPYSDTQHELLFTTAEPGVRPASGSPPKPSSVKEVILVIDGSGSMEGSRIDQVGTWGTVLLHITARLVYQLLFEGALMALPAPHATCAWAASAARSAGSQPRQVEVSCPVDLLTW
jgi:hypothetical protein